MTAARHGTAAATSQDDLGQGHAHTQGRRLQATAFFMFIFHGKSRKTLPFSWEDVACCDTFHGAGADLMDQFPQLSGRAQLATIAPLRSAMAK